MTKHELIKMMGNEDKAEWVMELVLKNVKRDFVLMCLKANAEEAKRTYEDRKASGYYKEFSSFPEGFNLFSEPEDSPLHEQWKQNRRRELDECGDEQYMNFASNMYVHALWH